MLLLQIIFFAVMSVLFLLCIIVVTIFLVRLAKSKSKGTFEIGAKWFGFSFYAKSSTDDETEDKISTHSKARDLYLSDEKVIKFPCAKHNKL